MNKSRFVPSVVLRRLAPLALLGGLFPGCGGGDAPAGMIPTTTGDAASRPDRMPGKETSVSAPSSADAAEGLPSPAIDAAVRPDGVAAPADTRPANLVPPRPLTGEGGPAPVHPEGGDSCKDMKYAVDPLMFNGIAFTIWIPGGVPAVRCVMAGPTDRADVARLHHCAMMTWPSEPKPPTGPQFQQALEVLGQLSGHPELQFVQILTSGYSHTYAERGRVIDHMPERFMVVFGGGIHSMYPKTPQVAHINWLSHNGERDNAQIPDTLKKDGSNWPWWQKNVQDARSMGALFGHAVRWNRFHEEADARHMLFPFMHEVLTRRAPPVGQPLTKATNIKLAEDSGWLVSAEDWNTPVPTIAAYKDYKGDKTKASWVPSRFMAHVLQASTAKSWQLNIGSPPCSDFNPLDRTKTWAACVPRSAGTMSKFDVVVDVLAGDQPKTVELWDGDKPLFALDQPPWVFPITGLTPGVHAFIAVGTYADGSKHLSKPRAVVVNRPGSSCSRPMTAPDAGAPATP